MNLPELRCATPGVRRAHDAILDRVTGPDALTNHAPVENVELRDLLVAYLIFVRDLYSPEKDATDSFFDEDRDHHYALRTIRATCVARARSMDFVRTFIDLAVTYPFEHSNLVETVATSTSLWPAQEVCDTDDVGRLTRKLHEDAGVTVIIPRRDYLVRRIRSAGQLRGPVFNLACTLARDWAGTLDELVETTNALYASPRATVAV